MVPETSATTFTTGRKQQIAMSKEESIKMALKRVSKERKYWLQTLNDAVKGFTDDEVASMLVRYVRDINFATLCEEEKQFFLYT